MNNVKIYELTNIDTKKWNELVGNNFFQTVEYAVFLKEKGITPFFFILESNSAYVGGTILYLKKIAFNLNYIIIPVAPIISKENIADTNSLIDSINKFIKERKIIYLDFYNQIICRLQDKTILEKLSVKDIKIYNAYIINLNNEINDIYQNMNMQYKKDITRAIKEGIHIEESKDINKFIEIMKKTYGRSKKKVDEKYILYEWNYLNNKYQRLFFAKKGDQYLAGALLQVYKNNAIYYHGASEKELPVGTTKLLQFEIIKKLKKDNFEYYDLTGGPLGQDITPKSQTIQDFKRRFGGEEMVCYGGYVIYSPIKKNVIEMLRKFKQLF